MVRGHQVCRWVYQIICGHIRVLLRVAPLPLGHDQSQHGELRCLPPRRLGMVTGALPALSGTSSMSECEKACDEKEPG